MEIDDKCYVDIVTGEVKFKQPKKVATSEKVHPPQNRSRQFQLNHGPILKKKKEMGTTPLLKRLQTKANKIKRGSLKNIPQFLEAMGLESGESVYKEILEIALNKTLPLEDRKDFLKFVGERTIAKRQQKMISVAGIPKIKTLDDITVASEIIHNRVCNGELTPDEGESMFRMYDNLRNILATQQLKVMMEDAQKMKENVVQTLSNGLLIEEVHARLELIDNKPQKFLEWFKDYLTIEGLVSLLKLRMEVPEQKNDVLSALKGLLK